MARREQESRAQALVNELVERIRQVSKLSELELSDDLIHPDNGKLSQLAREFTSDRQKREEDKLKPTQLRRTFHELKRMEQELRRGKSQLDRVQLGLTTAELAYALGRGVIPKPFYDLMKALLGKVADKEDFKRLTDFLTVLLAYHKYHEKVRSSQQSEGGEE
ncbi:hypothetical protein HRbin17_02719 [bacterium HR17]|uniref:CRISPR system Cms protein Csm2 n=1 Tax=Candidatus Fervidibacter japonicus TaxID=2035412 RepID=A0A2H5XG79_9BACT|nr:hypothetical protein HRbin17_02719 [bacterium HR17]